MKLTNNIMDDIERMGENREDVRQMVDRFYKRDNYKFVNEYLYQKETKRKHSKEELDKIKTRFIEMQPVDGSDRLTNENTIIGIGLFKYCEPRQFDTIKVRDFDGSVKLASEIKNMMNIQKPFEYQIHCYVKDSRLLDLAKITWAKFIESNLQMLDIE